MPEVLVDCTQHSNKGELMAKMTQEEMVEAVEETASQVGGDVRSDYSGRGMYGETCYGIVCDNVEECIEQGTLRGLRNANSDSMGRSYIVYWKMVKGE
jgi:hypothetical protein